MNTVDINKVHDQVMQIQQTTLGWNIHLDSTQTMLAQLWWKIARGLKAKTMEESKLNMDNGTTIGGSIDSITTDSITTGDTIFTNPGTTAPSTIGDNILLGSGGVGDWLAPDQTVEMDMSDLVEQLEYDNEGNNIEYVLLAYAQVLVAKRFKDSVTLQNALETLGRELAIGWGMSPLYESKNGRIYTNGNFKILVKVQG